MRAEELALPDGIEQRHAVVRNLLTAELAVQEKIDHVVERIDRQMRDEGVIAPVRREVIESLERDFNWRERSSLAADRVQICRHYDEMLTLLEEHRGQWMAPPGQNLIDFVPGAIGDRFERLGTEVQEISRRLQRRDADASPLRPASP